jgi:hypothetical protein
LKNKEKTSTAGSTPAVFMSHMLRVIPVGFQGLSLTGGESARHDCNMKQISAKPNLETTKRLLIAELETRRPGLEKFNSFSKWWDRSFNAMCRDYALGTDKSRLPHYLFSAAASGKALTDKNLRELARLLQGKINRRGQGAPADRQLIYAKNLGIMIFRRWMWLNREHKISTWGKREQIKAESAWLASEYSPGNIDPEKILDKMRRGKLHAN